MESPLTNWGKTTTHIWGICRRTSAFTRTLPPASLCYNGFAGIKYEKAQAENNSVFLTDEYITETILEVQQLFDNPDNVGYDGYEQFLIDNAYWDNIASREELLRMIAKNYADPNESVGYNSLPDL